MIYSMTGFGRGSGENEELSVEIDMKCVNNRYLDVQIRMPQFLFYLENAMKERIRDRIGRGRVDLYVQVRRKRGSVKPIEVALEQGVEMARALESLRREVGIEQAITLGDLLTNPDLLQTTDVKLDEELALQLVTATLDKVLDDCLTMKRFEGEKLLHDMESQLVVLEQGLDEVDLRLPAFRADYKEKLLARLGDFKEGLEIDDHRLSVELAFYFDKSDINEEIVRLTSHIDQFRSVLGSKRSSGKKLDFIIQEMNREVNTMSSKSNDVALTNTMVDMKSAIEKLKEQAANAE